MQPPQLEAKLSNAGKVVSALKCLLMTKRNSCLMVITSDGLMATVETSRIMQASVFLNKNLFKSFVVNQPEVRISCDLSLFLKSLNRFASRDTGHGEGSNTTDSYSNAGGDLLEIILTVREDRIGIIAKETGKVTTTSTLRIHDHEDEFAYFPPFDSSNTLCHMVMKWSLFKDVMEECEQVDVLGLYLKPIETIFWTESVNGRQETAIDRQMQDMISYSFHGTDVGSFIYGMKLFTQCMQPLEMASTVSIKASREGLLLIQYTIETDKEPIVVDYYLTSKYTTGDPYETEDPFNFGDLEYHLESPNQQIVSHVHAPHETSYHLDRSVAPNINNNHNNIL